MSEQTEFVEYVLDLLEPLDRVQTSRKIGGTLLKVDGNQLGVLFQNTAYFKVMDKDLQERYKKEGSKQFTYIRKPVSTRKSSSARGGNKKDPVIIKKWEIRFLQLIKRKFLSFFVLGRKK